ncbi:MAG: aminotransferase class IV [Bacteroidales bacterium]|nr:aminotransferase class IV [Bacteroidales bacterium]
MCQLLETIRIKQNMLQHIVYHNHRVNNSRKLLFHAKQLWDLSEIIQIPDLDQNTIYRCRFLYARKVVGFEFVPYIPRVVKKLYLVDCGDLNYSFKYSDRSALEKLKKNLPDPNLSDILLVKNGFITDTSFSNITLFDGSNWYTPSSPLLEGTKREYYINNKTILKCDISPSDLPKFKKVRLINAMLDLDNSDDIPMENIIIWK